MSDDPQYARMQAQAGHYATIIQIGRDAGDIVIEPRGPELRLDPRNQASVPSGAAERLVPYNRFLDCIGREEWLQRLYEWLNGPEPLSVRALIGEGGRGKTRMALELCRKAGDRWHAGFVPDGALKRLHEQQDPATWRWSGPTLAIVDYAAGQAVYLRQWLLALVASMGKARPPLRILLLERHGQADGGWWNTIFHQGSWDDEALEKLLPLPAPEELQPLTTADRLALFHHAVSRYGGSTAALQADTLLLQQLEQTDWSGDPLYLAMAAQVAVDAGAVTALSLSRSDLAFRVANREKHYLLKQAQQGNRAQEKLLPHLAAVVTLCQGLDRQRLIRVIKAEKKALGYGGAVDTGMLADLLSETLPADTQGEAAPIRPDMIGEAFILAELQDRDAAILRAFHVAKTHVVAMIMRCAQDFASTENRQPLAWLDLLLDQPGISTEDLWEIAGQLPQSSVALMEHAVRIHAELETRLRKSLPTQNSTDSTSQWARALNNLAVSLSRLGRREEALQQAQEAVAIYRELAAARPEAFRPDLAMSLNNLANFLSALGRREEALQQAQETVAIYRELAAARPEAFRPDLAMSLNNLANFLSKLGRREEALQQAQEAVAIYRALAAARPEAFRPDLAMSLNNLANRLSALGQREEALQQAQEAVAIYQELAAARPEAFRPDLAASLNNLANCLSKLGRREEALQQAQEAVAIRRELAAARPEAFRPNLATSLNNLANVLSELGRREEALQQAQEAVAIYRELAAARPEAFRPDLAMSLNNLANCLSALGQREEALQQAQEAVAIRRELAAARPEAFRPDLALSLHNLAKFLSELGRREEALQQAQEAVALYRELAAARPEAFRPDLAASLNNLANRLSALGQREEALQQAQEAVAIRRELAAARPEAFRPDLALSLHNLAKFLSELGRREEALQQAQEAVAIRRELAAARPEAFRPDLAMSLNNLADCLSELGRREEALQQAQEAVAMLGPYFLRYPMGYGAWMATMIRNYLSLCEKNQCEPDRATLTPFLDAF
ncbi:MAG: tetratricopeptide repeat protein [Magnetococcales bacterium]|nr:tetratricopeptide repeat protein [Magnetococcales bacterium]